jgi:glycosyltransferase involved in cell wall biosynthesis
MSNTYSMPDDPNRRRCSAALKLLGVIDDAPFDYRTWSGSSRYFFNALNNRGNLYDAIAPDIPKTTDYLYKALSFHPNLMNWKFKFHINVEFYRKMTECVKKKIEMMDAEGYNAILQIGAWYDLTKSSGKITASYHDGNLATLIKSPYGHPAIRDKYIKDALSYERELYDGMDFIFPMSRWLADSFMNDFGIHSSKILPVGAGINLPYLRNSEGKTYDAPNILFIGKDFKRKGGDQLLEAFNIVRKEIRDASLTLIGPDLRNLPDGVSCRGFVSKEDSQGVEALLNEYSKASVFVMPSLYEPFGIVFAEAMAHRLPCIGTNICAMPEIINHGVSGLLVPPGNISALATSIISLLKDPELCREMGQNSYIRYLKDYTWDSVAAKISQTIERLI